MRSIFALFLAIGIGFGPTSSAIAQVDQVEPGTPAPAVPVDPPQSIPPTDPVQPQEPVPETNPSEPSEPVSLEEPVPLAEPVVDDGSTATPPSDQEPDRSQDIFLGIETRDDDRASQDNSQSNSLPRDQFGPRARGWLKRYYRRVAADPEVALKSPNMVAQVRKLGGSAVPIIMPYQMTKDDASASYHQLKVNISNNGYTALLHEPGLDIVISGTQTYFKRSPDTSEDHRLQEDYMHGFESFDDGWGGSVSFGKYGADYNIEFYCKGLNEPTMTNCITKEKAEAFVIEIMEED